MDQSLTVKADTNRGAQPPLSIRSPTLQQALQTPIVGVTTSEGFEIRNGIWSCPQNLPTTVRREADNRAAAIRSAPWRPLRAGHGWWRGY